MQLQSVEIQMNFIYFLRHFCHRENETIRRAMKNSIIHFEFNSGVYFALIFCEFIIQTSI
jgi:hypothetical protein